MSDEVWLILQREIAEIQALAEWLSLTPTREPGGRIRVEVRLVGGFEADPEDLAGSIIREIHGRILEFETRLE
ncbi:MAG TPA: hypothetical protein VMV10_03570 [Pirellulales bacterium]|nr:hypothetical protein [Pirellulales bacterium]